MYHIKKMGSVVNGEGGQCDVIWCGVERDDRMSVLMSFNGINSSS